MHSEALDGKRWHLPVWLVSLIVLIAFLVSLLSVVAFSTRDAGAHTLQTQQALVVTQYRPHEHHQYQKGWDAGYRDTIKACILGKHTMMKAAPRANGGMTPYERGYMDGANAALKYARVCQPHGGHK